MHILITRPEPDASDLKFRLEARGHAVTVNPLMKIQHMPIDSAAFEGAQALVATSRNGLRALAESPAKNIALKLPVFSVGSGTAELARSLGFSRVITGAETASDLVPVIAGKIDPASGPIVHLAGETLAFDLATALEGKGVEVRKVIAYQAQTSKELDPQTAQMIANSEFDAVVLMSPRTASTFSDLVRAAGLTKGALCLTYLCISRAVARPLEGLGPVRSEIAARPNAEEIVRLAERVATHRSGV